MKNKLVTDINNYIAHLNANGLWVTVHGKGVSGLIENNIHRNAFCTYVKTDSGAWAKCVREQKKIFVRCNEECFFGMCHAGLEEYVFFANDNTFISVSGYGINQKKSEERIKRLSNEYCLDEKELLKIYRENLKHSLENQEQLSVIIRPLCHMLNMLQIYLANSEHSENNSLFDSIFGFVQLNFMQEITINDIAHACACSASTVSHLFKENTGFSVKSYLVKLRIEQAKKLFTTSNLPISSVASICGFSNINYFPTVFKKHTGVNPTEYKKTINTR